MGKKKSGDNRHVQGSTERNVKPQKSSNSGSRSHSSSDSETRGSRPGLSATKDSMQLKVDGTLSTDATGLTIKNTESTDDILSHSNDKDNKNEQSLHRSNSVAKADVKADKHELSGSKSEKKDIKNESLEHNTKSDNVLGLNDAEKVIRRTVSDGNISGNPSGVTKEVAQNLDEAIPSLPSSRERATGSETGTEDKNNNIIKGKSKIPVSYRDTKNNKISKHQENKNNSWIAVDEHQDTDANESQNLRKESSTSIKSASERSSASVSRSNSASEISVSDNIKVIIRVRPLTDAEKKKGNRSVVENPEKKVIWVDTNQGHTKPFSFTTVCGKDTSQEEVFNLCGIKELIGKALEGFSCTAFAFGQTGSGKTYTITGPVSQDIEKLLPQEDLQGLLPRSFKYLFDELSKQDPVYIVRASFLEVYNEKVQDLLNPSNYHDSLPVRWSSEKGFHVENLFTVECENLEDMMNVLNEGLRYRQMGGHALNEHSSRSHSMLTIYIDSEMNDPDEDFPIVKHGKISFVDLAGSERVKESKVSGEALTESQNINKSLLTLGNCIAALGDPKKRGGHIPYRDSKLTKLLADSLGGDGFTLMIACISPALDTVQDTLNTLRYANRAKNIKNKPVVRMDPREQLIMRLKRDIKLLKSENAYFREQVGVPSSDSQVAIPLNQFEGIVSPGAQSGTLSSAIGTNSLSSLHSNNKDGEQKLLPQIEGEENRATTAMYALNASFGLYDMLQGYMNENETLRTENLDLHQSRAVIQRQHELLSRENERLARKLEELERVFVSSPLPPTSSNDGASSLSSREGVSPWSLIRQRYLTRSGKQLKSAEKHDQEQELTDIGQKLVFPPIPKGTYPNYTAQDLSEDFAMESKKLKEERARKEKQAKNQSKQEKTTAGKGSSPLQVEDDRENSAGEVNGIVLQQDDGSPFEDNTTQVNREDPGQHVRQNSKTTRLARKPPVHKIRPRKPQYMQKEKKKGGYAALFATRRDKTKPSASNQSHGQTSNGAPSYYNSQSQYPPNADGMTTYYGGVQGYGSASSSLPHELQDLEGQIRQEFFRNQRQGYEK